MFPSRRVRSLPSSELPGSGRSLTPYGVESGLVALLDYNEVNELDPIRTERLSLLASLASDVSGALVALPPVRKWNAVICRPAPDGNHFYSAHWALNAGGATLALILDFAAFA